MRQISTSESMARYPDTHFLAIGTPIFLDIIFCALIKTGLIFLTQVIFILIINSKCRIWYPSQTVFQQCTRQVYFSCQTKISFPLFTETRMLVSDEQLTSRTSRRDNEWERSCRIKWAQGLRTWKVIQHVLPSSLDVAPCCYLLMFCWMEYLQCRKCVCDLRNHRLPLLSSL